MSPSNPMPMGDEFPSGVRYVDLSATAQTDVLEMVRIFGVPIDMEYDWMTDKVRIKFHKRIVTIKQRKADES